MNKDLTTGKPEKVLWQFCLPLFGSIIFQQLYNIADSFVAGKFISDNALAAVGNSYEITLIFIAFAFGCNIACSVLAALFFGAKQYKDLKTAVYTALISSCVICAALMLVGTLCCDSLLRLIKTPEEVFADSKLYLDIYIYGLPFVFLYNVATGIFSALGDSKTPFIFLACSSTSNIAVDILFVTAFNMGVAGVNSKIYAIRWDLKLDLPLVDFPDGNGNSSGDVWKNMTALNLSIGTTASASSNASMAAASLEGADSQLFEQLLGKQTGSCRCLSGTCR